ncbi:hypothetical protein GCM10009727_65570 [Actinomadura napierensis]|uniref:DUF397 domain-containing protein n=1 Tax=Actinomadura napierensis TaxID=267854 RepID=A0ABP5LYT1_9ACTN
MPVMGTGSFRDESRNAVRPATMDGAGLTCVRAERPEAARDGGYLLLLDLAS